MSAAAESVAVASAGPSRNVDKPCRQNAVLLTQTRLKEILHYDPQTGIFTWINSGKGHVAGMVAGTKVRGYLQIEADGKLYRGHIIAWLYMKGEFPAYRVVPKNLDGCDTRWRNLRLDLRAKARGR